MHRPRPLCPRPRFLRRTPPSDTLRAPAEIFLCRGRPFKHMAMKCDCPLDFSEKGRIMEKTFQRGGHDDTTRTDATGNAVRSRGRGDPAGTGGVRAAHERIQCARRGRRGAHGGASAADVCGGGRELLRSAALLCQLGRGARPSGRKRLCEFPPHAGGRRTHLHRRQNHDRPERDHRHSRTPRSALPARKGHSVQSGRTHRARA